jgi:hypothetical protein
LAYDEARALAVFSRNIMNRMKGLTIIQLMVTLLVAGIVGKILLDVLIAKRCESKPSLPLCVDRKDGRA